ncbi:hypothetical protein PoB_006772800 [Plakobranchus ocellatus]|uniref:Uncharacterized protein n=1 Tax=Plakobranchus ocellatus TaxID=259542 RepID=A0AAV4DAI5_9GAST|nr:hypothetical protein PoB_006772800 [Plakobranchus ocellatus]
MCSLPNLQRFDVVERPVKELHLEATSIRQIRRHSSLHPFGVLVAGVQHIKQIVDHAHNYNSAMDILKRRKFKDILTELHGIGHASAENLSSQPHFHILGLLTDMALSKLAGEAKALSLLNVDELFKIISPDDVASVNLHQVTNCKGIANYLEHVANTKKYIDTVSR